MRAMEKSRTGSGSAGGRGGGGGRAESGLQSELWCRESPAPSRRPLHPLPRQGHEGVLTTPSLRGPF